MALIIWDQPGKRVRFTIDQSPAHIGRGKLCEVKLMDKTVSEFHAELVCRDGGWTIEDRKSRNGTTVNGAPLEKKVPATLQSGDIISVGRQRLLFFEDDEQDSFAIESSIVLDLKNGCSTAAARLWAEYFDKIVQVAKKKLVGVSPADVDEEDVALNVMDSLFRGAAKGNFKRLRTRHDLWNLLLAITKQKAIDRRRKATTQKQGKGEVRGPSVFAKLGESNLILDLAPFAIDENTPELIKEMQEQADRLLDQLPSESLRKIAIMRMEGYRNHEIANHFGHTERWVEKKVKKIRSLWISSAMDEEQ